MSNFKEIDSYKSFKAIEHNLEIAVNNEEVSKKEASSILREARESYRKQNYNKLIQKVNNA